MDTRKQNKTKEIIQNCCMGLGKASEETSHNVALGLAGHVPTAIDTDNQNNNTKNRETDKRIYGTTFLLCLIKLNVRCKIETDL